MIPRQNTPAQPGRDLLGLPLRPRELLRRPRLSLLVRVVGPVQRREALEVRGRPGVDGLLDYLAEGDT